MWFDRSKESRVAEAPQHWTTERMILEGHADYATREDLEGMDEGLLIDISKICEVPTAAPEECIPCLAYAMVMERREEQRHALENMNPATPDAQETIKEVVDPPADAVGPDLLSKQKPRKEASPFPGESRHADPTQEIHRTVRYLDGLLEELLNGPPIPPRDVTTEELAILVVAAQRWIKITEAQGVELAPTQQRLLEATKTLVARLNRGENQ